MLATAEEMRRRQSRTPMAVGCAPARCYRDGARGIAIWRQGVGPGGPRPRQDGGRFSTRRRRQRRGHLNPRRAGAPRGAAALGFNGPARGLAGPPRLRARLGQIAQGLAQFPACFLRETAALLSASPPKSPARRGARASQRTRDKSRWNKVHARPLHRIARTVERRLRCGARWWMGGGAPTQLECASKSQGGSPPGMVHANPFFELVQKRRTRAFEHRGGIRFRT